MNADIRTPRGDTAATAPYAVLCDYCETVIEAGDPAIRLTNSMFACSACTRCGVTA